VAERQRGREKGVGLGGEERTRGGESGTRTRCKGVIDTGSNIDSSVCVDTSPATPHPPKPLPDLSGYVGKDQRHIVPCFWPHTEPHTTLPFYAALASLASLHRTLDHTRPHERGIAPPHRTTALHHRIAPPHHTAPNRTAPHRSAPPTDARPAATRTLVSAVSAPHVSSQSSA
jgi:hypothetical protein